MLPIPIENFLPEQLRNDDSPLGVAFINKVNSLMTAIRDETLNLKYSYDPTRTPGVFLNELGYFLNAGILAFDSERTKRKKIATAIHGHKKRGTWENDVKNRIDAITGYSATFFRSFGRDDWVLVGDGTTPPTHYWASMGADGIDDDLGLLLMGTDTDPGLPGIFSIDCHEGIDTAVLTAAQIEQIITEIAMDAVPAYFRILLGYVNNLDQYVIYPGGIIE